MTFSLSGKITDSTTSTVIAGAIVFIGESPNAGKSATSDASGNYTFTGLQPSGFTVTASARTYLSQSKSVTLTANQTLDFTLQSTPPPSQFVSTPPAPTSSTDPIIGQYALTLRVGSECAAIPDVARNRNYTATIDAGSTGSYVVTLSDAVFLRDDYYCGSTCNKFLASRDGDSVRFDTYSKDDFSGFWEAIPPGMWLQVQANGVGRFDGSTIVASLAGPLWYCPGQSISCSGFVSCSSNDMRFTFTRR